MRAWERIRARRRGGARAKAGSWFCVCFRAGLRLFPLCFGAPRLGFGPDLIIPFRAGAAIAPGYFVLKLITISSSKTDIQFFAFIRAVAASALLVWCTLNI